MAVQGTMDTMTSQWYVAYLQSNPAVARSFYLGTYFVVFESSETYQCKNKNTWYLAERE